MNASQVLWRPDDISDSFYIVINGRLRAISEKPDGNITILAEYGQGDTVGELDVITSSRRRTMVHAIRDTELIRMPRTLFNAISSRYGTPFHLFSGQIYINVVLEIRRLRHSKRNFTFIICASLTAC